jgi:hypothetical protein
MIQKLYWFNNQDFINKYYIDDVVNQNTEVLFILESPSQREILCNAPASGHTGRKITRKLLCKDCKRGIGELIKHNLISNNNDARKIGIMNISQIPMQLKDYSIEDLDKIDKCKLTNLSWLRKTIQSSGEIKYSYQDCSIKKNNIIQDILSSFCYRLYSYLNKYNKISKIYLSGNIAQAFFKNCCYFNFLNFLFDIKNIKHLSVCSNETINDVLNTL